MGVGRERFVIAYQLLIAAVGLCGAMLYIPRLLQHNLAVTLLLFAVAVTLESIPVPLGRVMSSLLYALPIGALVVYGVSEVVWLMVAASLLGALFSRQKSRWHTILFNAGQYVLCVLAMSQVYDRLMPSTGAQILTRHVFAGLIVGAAVFVVVNHFLIQLLQVVRGTFRVRDMVNTLAADSLYMLISMPFAFLMVAFGASNRFLALVAVLPLLLFAYMLRMHRRTSFIERIHNATAKLTSEFDVDRIAEEAARVAAELTYADASVVYVLDEELDVLQQVAVYPQDARRDFSQTEIPSTGGGVIWEVIRQENWCYVPDVRKDERVVSDGVRERVPYLSMAIFPMRSRGRVHGALVCYACTPYAFGELTQELCILATQVGVLVENARLYQELQRQSWQDGATGLYNYRYYYQELSKRVDAAKYARQPLSVVVTDVDYFKKFNDTYGHLAGDAVLRSLAQVLIDETGDHSVVARYGGEEFGIILPVSPVEALEIVERVRVAVGRHVVVVEGHEIHGITVSSGIAGYPEDGESDRDLLLKADSAMYWGAKQRGRNRTALYTPEFDAQLFVDALTGLYTYHFVTIRLREALSHGAQNWGALCIDIAHFSTVNQSFGFEVGDRVLQEASNIIRESVRNNELACRYSGDEFLILLRDVTAEELESIGRRIDRLLSSHRFHCLPNVTLSLHVRYQTSGFHEIDNVETMFTQINKVFSELNTSRDESRGAV